MASEMFTENNAAILEYVGSHSGFFGIIKQRFSDFHVNEITAADEIVHLTSKTIDCTIDDIAEEGQDRDSIKQPSDISNEVFSMLEVLAKKKSIHELKMKVSLSDEGDKLLKCNPVDKAPADVKINVTHLGKAERKEIHQYVKAKFPELCSNTLDVDPDKFISIYQKGVLNPTGKKQRSDRPKSKTYTTFVLYKENIDTASCVNLIAGKLRMKSSSFAYAGMKDRRAKTSQLVSCFKVCPENLSRVCASLRGVHIGNFNFLPTPQKLGQLRGNHFTIVLREVNGSDEDLLSSIGSLKSNGFLNYYGLQRFSGGGGSSTTHDVGKAILTSNWKEALELIMASHRSDSYDMGDARRVWRETKDAGLALKKLKPYHRNSIEGCLLSALTMQGNMNVVNALDKVPRSSRLLYIHAYQSFIWNTIVSRRVQTYGLKVLPGDLVKIKTKEKLGLGGEKVDKDVTTESAEGEVVESTEDSEPVYILSEDDVCLVSVTDIVLPLPGHKVVYPDNEMRKWYDDLLQNDGLSSEKLQHKVKAYALTGAYRTMLVLPNNFEHQICFYNDPLKPLVTSDLEKMEGLDYKDNVLDSGEFKGVILSFSLPPSSYATMALRELLRMGTSAQYHTSLNANGQTSEVKVDLKRKAESGDEATNPNKKLNMSDNRNGSDNSSVVFVSDGIKNKSGTTLPDSSDTT